MPDNALPQTIGAYRIHGVLGRGGMGVVYFAEHRDSHRPVALKTVGALTPDALASIRLEIGTLTRLRHPGIVEIVDQGVGSSGPWYAMELLEGETLEDRHHEIWPRHPSEESTPRASIEAVHARTPRPQGSSSSFPPSSPSSPSSSSWPFLRSSAAGGHLAEILAIYRRLCVPLAFLHGKGIVHRDIKPGNVFLRDGDHPVLMDFGLMARASGGVGREELEGTRGIRGTLSYLAPEICEGQTPDSRADLYALGCMIWESLTGRPPFEAATTADLLAMHMRARPGRPSDVVIGVPEALDDLVTRLLAKRPQDRVGHAEDVAEALAEIERKPGGESSAGGFRRAGHLFRPKMVGRDQVLGDLLALGERIRTRSGALALVAGESGIGKTFLVSEVAQRISVQGIRVITGECLSVGSQDGARPEHSGLPLQPFRQLLQAMGDRCRQLGRAEANRMFGPNLRLFIPYEPGLAEIDGADRAPEPASLPTDAARERLMTALREALVAFVTECPSLLVLDDLQWADELSLAVLDSLSRELIESLPLVIVGTYRTDEASDELRRFSSRPWIHRVELGRLHAGEVAAMVAHMLAAGPAPDVLVRFVQEHAEGIPFFVAEYLRAASAKGVLIRRRGRWLVGEAAGGEGSPAAAFTISLPRHIAGLVRLRLSRLSPAAVAAAEVASLLGRELDAWALAATLELDAAALQPLLVELVERQVLEGAAPGRYRFLHDKIREEAYGGIAPERRRDLHVRAARALEERAPEGADQPRYAELGYHLLAAGEPARAIHHLAKAGDLALAMSAHGDAASHYQTVLSLAAGLAQGPAPLQVATWERQLGDALLGLGKMSDSIAALTRAARALGWPLPRSRAAIALRLPLEMARQLLHRLFPGQFAGRRAHRSLELLEAGRVFDRLMRAFYYKGQYLELMFTNLKTLNLSELAGPSPELAMAYASAAATAIMIPVRKLASIYFALAFATLRKTPDPVVESHVEMLVGLQHFFLGQRRDAIRHTEAAMQLARNLGFSRRYDEVTSVRVGADLRTGRHGAVRGMVAEMEASATRRGDAQMLSWALVMRAQCCILRGSLEQAGDLLRRVEALLPGLEPPEVILAFAHLAYVLYRQGDLAGARSYAARASAATSHGPPVYGPCSPAYVRLAEVQVALARHASAGERRPALRAAARACKLLLRATRTFPMLDPMYALHEGTRLRLLGQRKRADRMWRQGLLRASTLADGYAGAGLALALGATLGAATPQRQQLEAYARESLTKLEIGELALPDPDPLPIAPELVHLGPPDVAPQIAE